MDFRIFIYAENDFNHITEEFLDYQRRNNSSASPNQAIRCTCPFTGFNQPFFPQLGTCPYLQERATKSVYLVRFYFYFIAVIIIIVVFLNFNTHSPPHFENNSMKTFKRGTFVFVLADQWIQLCFLKQEITIPQHLWFSNSFYIVDGCIDCVKGILNS